MSRYASAAVSYSRRSRSKGRLATVRSRHRARRRSATPSSSSTRRRSPSSPMPCRRFPERPISRCGAPGRAYDESCTLRLAKLPEVAVRVPCRSGGAAPGRRERSRSWGSICFEAHASRPGGRIGPAEKSSGAHPPPERNGSRSASRLAKQIEPQDLERLAAPLSPGEAAPPLRARDSPRPLRQLCETRVQRFVEPARSPAP